MNTYRILVNRHFSDTKFYKPVEPGDTAGSDLKCMTDDFKSELNTVANQLTDENERNLSNRLDLFLTHVFRKRA